jgi:hypothetical protein
MYQDIIGTYRVIVIEQEQAALRAERARMLAERAAFVPVEGRWSRMLHALGPRRVARSRSSRAGSREACPGAEHTLAGA